jgi:hypothetical protein
MAKTTIEITGQIFSNGKLRDKISANAPGLCRSEHLNVLNAWHIDFPTKREAKKALWGAYKELRQDPNNKGILSYSKFGALRYDASSAEIK